MRSPRGAEGRLEAALALGPHGLAWVPSLQKGSGPQLESEWALAQMPPAAGQDCGFARWCLRQASY